MNIAVFASHGGSNLQALIDAVSEHRIAARICAVISNNSDAQALERARQAGIPAYHLSTKTEGGDEALAAKLTDVLAAAAPDMIFLLGYMRMLPVEVLRLPPAHFQYPPVAAAGIRRQGYVRHTGARSRRGCR